MLLLNSFNRQRRRTLALSPSAQASWGTLRCVRCDTAVTTGAHVAGLTLWLWCQQHTTDMMPLAATTKQAWYGLTSQAAFLAALNTKCSQCELT
jgi:hypothetical protein